MSDQSTLKQTTSPRLISLDAMRGFTIALMIVVNDPGSWSHVYAPLLHAKWHGFTPTDLVFPFFLYIVGVSVVLAYTKRLSANKPKKDMYKKIVWRSFKIFAVGIFLALFHRFSFVDLRITGVLQRIAIVFLVCAFLFLNSDWKKQAYIGAGVLVAYWLLMAIVPVPIDDIIRESLASGMVMRAAGEVPVEGLKQISDGFITANYEPGVNFAAWFDRIFLPGRHWEKTFDPEGLLTTLPAIVTGITGMLAGAIIVSKESQDRKVIWLFFFGFLAYVLGTAWSWFFPLNKNLWSSSFVLYTSGLATMLLAACVFFVDMLGKKGWTKPGIIFGANAITIYVLAGMLTKPFGLPIFGDESIRSMFFNGLVEVGLAPKFVSLLYALLYTIICFIPGYILYKKKVFIKL
jgi:predicted acyltransferase